MTTGRSGILAAAARGALRPVLQAHNRSQFETELHLPALAIAPHPDDETFGCGGVIARKALAGVDVQVVFLTDGSRSHEGLIDPAELAKIRRQEAMEAVKALGLAPHQTHYLGYVDRTLEDHGEVVEQLAELMRRLKPATVFVPSRLEAHSDHRAAWAFTLKALGRTHAAVSVYEYVISAWSSWPWTSHPPHSRGLLRDIRGGWRQTRSLLKALNEQVDISGVLGRKLSAVGHYRSQMQRLRNDSRWITFPDISNGELLRALTAPRESFCRYRLRDGAIVS